MKLLIKTIYIFSLRKIEIAFYNKIDGYDYKANKLKVFIHEGRTVLCLLLHLTNISNYLQYFKFSIDEEKEQFLIRDNFVLNSIALYQKNVKHWSSDRKPRCNWENLL